MEIYNIRGKNYVDIPKNVIVSYCDKIYVPESLKFINIVCVEIMNNGNFYIYDRNVSKNYNVDNNDIETSLYERYYETTTDCSGYYFYFIEIENDIELCKLKLLGDW